MRAVLKRIAVLPVVPEGGVDPVKSFSFGIEGRVAGESRAFESILDRGHAASLFTAMHAVFYPSDTRATAAVRRMAGFALKGSPPLEVTDQAHIVFGLDSLSGGTARVTNIGSTTWKGPVLLVVALDPGYIEGTQEDEVTLNITPYRPHYILAGGASIAPGKTVSRSVGISNGSEEPFTFHGRIFAGPGIP
jgi:hypothetical protein